ncbi:hypothetical protein PoB_001395500 [Plakobranchus ocellatus]|uniref:Uncharacterized protein n=1 Tax=Plakobranchus ocellatus TaxID=259542 RepID=A0AAV3YX32_9GAST|nr:hypothetical protein PoB_001395500 [Plakobranchus ocellatus]
MKGYGRPGRMQASFQINFRKTGSVSDEEGGLAPGGPTLRKKQSVTPGWHLALPKPAFLRGHNSRLRSIQQEFQFFKIAPKTANVPLNHAIHYHRLFIAWQATLWYSTWRLRAVKGQDDGVGLNFVLTPTHLDAPSVSNATQLLLRATP